jgi:hypothetical protein
MKNLITLTLITLALSACVKKIALPNIEGASSSITVQTPAPVAEAPAPAAPSKTVTFSGASD